MPHFAFVMEQTLGHVTHHQNLARYAEEASDFCAHWLPVHPGGDDLWERLPVVRGNWSLKSSLRARNALSALYKKQKPDALFLHTQTLALCALPFMRQTPSVVSLDATPLNYDTVGEAYGHRASSGLLEKQKMRWHCALFAQAAALTTWCQWAKDSLVQDYGVPPQKVTVIPPGVDMDRWAFGKERDASLFEVGRSLRMLFVGGDFERKGGETLLEAFHGGLNRLGTLDIVTKEEALQERLRGTEGVQVHLGLTANSAPLRELFARADVFVFPTLADCLPLAVMEAMAAGLPVITTDVGALREEVEPNVNGLLVPPKDAGAIVAAVQRLSEEPALRRSMASRSRELAEARFCAKRNYNAILNLLRSVAKKEA